MRSRTRSVIIRYYKTCSVRLREWFVNMLRAFTSFDGRVLDRGPRVLRCDRAFAFAATARQRRRPVSRKTKWNGGKKTIGKLSPVNSLELRNVRTLICACVRSDGEKNRTVQRWTDRETRPAVNDGPEFAVARKPRCARRPDGQTRLFDRAPRALHWQYKTPRLGIPLPPSSATDSAYSRRRHARAPATAAVATARHGPRPKLLRIS